MTNSDKSYQSNLDRALYGLALDAKAGATLQAQLLQGLRDEILSCADYSGCKLPASRLLAAELSVSRTTVQMVYDQLISEGYLTARQGAGTFVAAELPHLSPIAPRPSQPPPAPAPWVPFQSSLPDPALMPHAQWARHLERAWRRPEPALLGRPDPLGWYPLRAAIAEHLGAWRQLHCRAEQVIITSGASEAFGIIARGLLPPDPVIAFEDPCWQKMPAALTAAGAIAQPVRIDAEGFDSRLIPEGTRAAIVTPSRHYPTGVSLTLSRRLALLDWARMTGGLVIEDDYDSEFRYRGQPLPALAGLDGLEHVVYLGSFSKLLSASLRLGYIVLPERLLPQAQRYLQQTGAHASLVPQPALAQFMQSGDFALHLRRMRRHYGKRQAHLLNALAPLRGVLDLAPDPGGMHLCLPLRPELRARWSDAEICDAARAKGLVLAALSEHSLLEPKPQALLLGYAGFDEAALSYAAACLVELLGEGPL